MATIDKKKQITYWRSGSDEDWEVVVELMGFGRTRHGRFVAHLAVEEMLKAHVCRATGNLAPKIHTLVRLAELARLSISDNQRAFLGQFNQYQPEGRNLDALTGTISASKAKTAFRKRSR